MNQDEEIDLHETLLTRLSRKASVIDPNNNCLSYIGIFKQKALDEYECVDNETLLQLKKVFSILKLSIENNKVIFNKIQELCNENKMIKINPEEIWKLLSLLSLDNNEGNIHKQMTINFIIFTEIENYIKEKTGGDEIDDGNKSGNSSDDNSEEDPTEFIERIISNSESIQQKSVTSNEKIKSLINLVNNFAEKTKNLLNAHETNLEDVLSIKDEMLKKINEVLEKNKTINKELSANNKRMERIQFYINKLKANMQNLEDDYKALNEKYENNQNNVDNNADEVERLFGENLSLCQDKENNENEIKRLKEEIKEMETNYNHLSSQLYKSQTSNKDLQNEINEMKIKNSKYKTDFQNALEKLLSIDRKYSLDFNEQNGEHGENAAMKNGLNLLHKQENLMKKKRNSQLKFIINFDDETSREKIIKYIKELEDMNEVLSEKNKDFATRLNEYEKLIKNNPYIKDIIMKDSDPSKLLNLNEVFSPSGYDIDTERIRLISKFSNFNPKKNRIVKIYSIIIGKNALKKINPTKFMKSNFVINIISDKKKKFELKTFNSRLSITQNINKPNKEMQIDSLRRSYFDINIIRNKKPKVEYITDNTRLSITHNINTNKGFPKEKLNKSNFDVNIIRGPKPKIEFKTNNSRLSMTQKTNKEYKIESVSTFNILRKIDIKNKRNEFNVESRKINLSYKDDSNIVNTNKILKIEKFEDSSEDIEIVTSLAQRTSSIMLQKKERINKDYYYLYLEEYIRRKLSSLNDKCSGGSIYSDKISVLVERKTLVKKYLLLSPLNFCIIEPNSLKFVYIDKITNIKNIVISNKNPNMVLFRFNDGEDLLIESLRTYDLILFMKNNYFPEDKEMFRYEDKFIIKLKGQLQRIVVTDKVLINIPNMDGALKVGYLFFYKANFISSNFTQVLGALINIGLVIFDEATLKPMLLIPIIGSEIRKVEKERFGNNNCFEIVLPSGETKVFSSKRAKERRSWLIHFSKMQTDYEEKMKKIGAIKKQSKKNI